VRWIHENPPHWDETKAAIAAAAPAGSLRLPDYAIGDLVSGEWWRVEDGGEVLGYGWMDCTWGDAEVLLVVDDASRRRGVGTFILDQLEREAARRGLHYLYNVIPEELPDREGLARWLENRRFEPDHGDRWVRRVIHPAKGG
jgi:GNAT superfamily N-acetyltransferase